MSLVAIRPIGIDEEVSTVSWWSDDPCLILSSRYSSLTLIQHFLERPAEQRCGKHTIFSASVPCVESPCTRIRVNHSGALNRVVEPARSRLRVGDCLHAQFTMDAHLLLRR